MGCLGMCRRGLMVGGVALLAGAAWAGGAEGPAATQSAGAGAGVSGAGDNRRAPQYWLGVAVENIPPPIARQLKLGREQGLMVLAVLRDSPAEHAGVKAEDLLIELEGQPLTSQAQLARAANTVEESAGVVAGPTKSGVPASPRPKKCRLTLLRDGDRVEVEITPEPRPASMMVAGGDMTSFTLRPREGVEPGPEVRNYVLPNGSAAQVGPGYRFDLSGRNAGGLTEVSIRQLVGTGQTIILTQEQDETGAVKNSITVGGQKYMVEAGKVASLPEKLRPLAEQLLAEAPGTATRPAGEATGALDQRVKDLEAKNEALQGQLSAMNEQLSELIRLLKEKNNSK